MHGRQLHSMAVTTLTRVIGLMFFMWFALLALESNVTTDVSLLISLAWFLSIRQARSPR